MKINKILVPIDFSLCAINALKIATQIAEKQRAKLLIMNAIQIPTQSQADVIAMGTVVQPILEESEKTADEQFEAIAKQVPGLNDVQYETKKMINSIPQAINTCLEEDTIDLVVMGTKGSHNPIEKMIGSNSSDVIQQSNIPVLMIPQNVGDMNLKHIGFAADLQKVNDLKKLDILILLAKMNDAEIKIFHVSDDQDIATLEEDARERMQLESSLSGVKHTYTWINSDEALEGIFDFVAKNKLDMLAMHPRQHGFWDRLINSSVTKQVAMQIEIPLLTIHE